MPAVPPGSLVLVTGASGYIAVHLVEELIRRGYRVRGTVRSADKGEYLKQKFTKDFEYVIVEDVEHEGGFDEAVKGVDAVEHTASPFHFKPKDPYEDLVNPAVNGTNSVLEAVKKHGSSVKRVVVTSSFASIVDTSKPAPSKFTEQDWNENSVKQLEQKKKDVSAADAYRASKTLAEQAAWKFVELNKLSWDLVTLCPPLVLGPIQHQVSSPEKLNTSVSQWYAWLSGANDGAKAPGLQSCVVDVRDLAFAHVLAISVEKAGGNRFAISAQPHTWQMNIDAVYGDPEVMKDWPKLPRGQPGADKIEDQNLLDNTKSKKMLGMTYRPYKQTLLDTAKSLAEYEKAGWKN